MAGKPVGTMFAEMDLDLTPMEKKLKLAYDKTVEGTQKFEQTFKQLGIQSDRMIESQRQTVIASYNAIKNSASSTANDIIRAEEAKNAKLKMLNDQQYGVHKSTMDKMKDGFQAMTGHSLSSMALITAASATVGYAIKQAFEKGFKAVEDYNTSVASMAALYMTFSEQKPGQSMAQQWKEALTYSRGIVPVLEQIAAKTLLSGQETVALANAFARSGVFLDATNKKQVEAFTTISNALPMLTKGQEIMKQINSEIRGVMTGANEQTSMLLQTLKAVDPQVEGHLKTWRAQGTVLEHVGELLKGFIPATQILELQWEAVKSTLDTTVTQVLRGGMFGAYEDIIKLTLDLNSMLEANKEEIQVGIAIAWSIVKDTMMTAVGILQGFGPILSDMGGLIGDIAYGWGAVMAALRPIGQFLGNSIAVTYELVNMIAHAGVAIFELARGNIQGASDAWANAKKNFEEAARLSEKNRDLLVNGIAESIQKYGDQVDAARNANKQITASSQQSTDARAQQTRLLMVLTKEAGEKVAEQQAKTYEGAKKLMDEQVAIARKAGVDEVSIKKYVAAESERIKTLSHNKEAKAGEAAAKKQQRLWESGQKEYERIMDEEYAYSENTGNKEYDAAEERARKKTRNLDEMLRAGKISQQQYADGIILIEINTQDRIGNIRKKAMDTFEDLLSSEADFATTENERQINQIIAQEGNKIAKLTEAYEKLSATYEEGSAERLALEDRYFNGVVDIVSNSTQAQYEMEVRNNLRIANAKYDMIQNIAGYEEEAYQLKLVQIEAEKQERIKKAGQTAEAVVLAEKWAADQTQLAFIKMGKAGDDWKNGVLASLLETSRAHTTWGNTFYEVTKTATDNARNQLQTNLFNVWKGDISAIAVDWQSMLDTIGQTLTRKISDMIMEAAAEQIVLFFKSEWTEGGSNVLGIVNSVLGFAGSLFGSSGVNDMTGGWGVGGIDPAVANGPAFASGGRVPGSPSNVDSVAAMLAPGEHVIPSSLVQAVAQQGRSGDTMLAHINPAEAAVLKMLGGSGTVNPATGLPEFFYDANGNWVDYIDPVSGLIPDPVYVAPVDPFARGNQSLTYAVRNLPEVVKSYFLNSYLNTNLAGSIADYMSQGTRIGRNADGSYVVAIGNYGDPYSNASTYTISAAGSMTGWTPRHGLDTSSTFMSEYGSLITGGLSFLNPLLGLITAPLVAGATVANDEVGWLDVLPTMLTSMAGTTLAMLGGYQGIGDLLKTGISGTGTAATHEGAHAAGVEAILAEMAEQYPSTFAGSIYDTWGNLFNTGFDMATNTVLKQGIKYAINSLFGGGGDASNYNMRLSYMGADDHGLLASLYGQIPGGWQFPFSAAGGLDYVPRDNFKINAHEGEAVLNKKEAKQWREGKGTISLSIHIENFYGDSEGINALAERVGDILDNYNRKGWRA